MKVNKSPDQFKVIVLTWPQVKEDSSSTESNQPQGQSFPFTGTVNEIGKDMQRLNEMGIDHVIFNYNFLPEGRDIARVIDTSKKLAKFVE